MSQTNSKEVFIFEMTEEEYQEGLAKGWTEDDMLPVGKHEFRRATRFRNVVKIEDDVMDFLRQRSDEPYEKQINAELRKLMEREKLKA